MCDETRSKRKLRRKAREGFVNSVILLSDSINKKDSSTPRKESPLIHRQLTNEGLASNTNKLHADVNSFIFNSATEFVTGSCEYIDDISSNVDSNAIVPESNEFDLRSELRHWSLKNNITHQATTELLKIIGQHACFSKIPQDARTLLATPTGCNVKLLPPGEYISFDWTTTLAKILEKLDYSPVCKLQINIDGIPIYRSSNKQFWPILGCVVGQKSVFTIGIYSGNGKPGSVDAFLDEFVDSCLLLCKNGLVINNHKIQVNLSAFICDAPARAFISGVKNHTGYYACSKCTSSNESDI